MKVNVSQEELEGLDRASLRGAIEGIVGGLAISVPASYYLHRNWGAYRRLPLSLKALGVVLIVGPTFAIQTERRGLEYDEAHHWHGASKNFLDMEKEKEESHWETLSTSDKVRKWATDNQYKVILGSWAISMAIAAGIIMRDKHQSTSQKVVQARMWAQGLTIGVLVGAGVLTHSQREEAAKHPHVDHSWRQLLEAEAREEQKRKIPLVPAQPAHSS
ncbi:hypothetical protein EVG20_g11 [Dentipellis fragilis]|uniref:HIG1 domain-containing protein n=1 Tax=Dentipellis fragilis TaxID=205917 RepID=A0A4Y9ZGM5_9AGAM|nr:hypothetical protein EVG20_g11 [Dentipellis fragilis]